MAVHHGNEISGSMKGREFNAQISNYQILYLDSAELSWVIRH
jgi:hypothetical protein